MESAAVKPGVSCPAEAIFFWMSASVTLVESKLRVSSLDLTFQSAELTPETFAAVSILFLHIPQFPQTLIVSVFDCANTDCANRVNIKRAVNLKDFINFCDKVFNVKVNGI